MVKDLNISIKSEKSPLCLVFGLKRRKSCIAELLSPMGRVLIFFFFGDETEPFCST